MIHSVLPTPNTQKPDALNARSATAMSMNRITPLASRNAGDNSKTVTPMNIHLASPTPNTRQQDALNARAATASGMPSSGRKLSTTEKQKQSQASSTDQPRRHAPSSSASNRNGQSSTSSSQRGHAECHGAGKPKSAGTKYK
ncbi:uncharacterized protein LOC119341393 isoform X2 [Triticum dicoccoides]|uniref:uncharacterized protein LOC119341393 isoform X2 n=1 Tax=Triticum dicoccoides TaxID=85692 RepID=UPI0018919F69|nr:uncharacterized protein LOC119341393 isoform X2 [Triticum dicoccoides]